ncbi:MAG: transposase [Bacteroidota bacterium]|nr:transposase [Bacteroidota bacterium]
MEAGKLYHIYNRGNNRDLIFYEEENYKYFMRQFRKYLSRHVNTFAYCLMPNHFHFVVEIIDDPQSKKINISKENDTTTSSSSKISIVEKAFKNFFISYAKAINKRIGRTGSLFQYKFKRKEITDEEYLLRLIIYLHLNPVSANIVSKPNEWKYSSYNGLINNMPTRLRRDEVIKWFGGIENFIFLHDERQALNDEDVMF